MRGRYRSRRSALVAALENHLPDARVHGVPAGTFLLVSLAGPLDLQGLLRRAAESGVGVRPVDSSSSDIELVLGYANLSEPAIERGIALLADALIDR
jgi:GntR family transcriptional regulator/MocR family aminotransferase